jgi:hypothetical protein
MKVCLYNTLRNDFDVTNTAVSLSTSAIRFRKSDLLGEKETNREPVSHYFKWEKL